MTRRLVQALVGLAVGGLAIAFYSYWYVERATPFSNIAIGMAGICMGLFGLWATRDFPYTRWPRSPPENGRHADLRGPSCSSWWGSARSARPWSSSLR